MSDSGKSGNNRRRRHRFSKRKGGQNRNEKKKQNDNTNIFAEGRHEKSRANNQPRMRWTAPVLPPNPITAPDCPWCGKQIKDITAAISDKESGQPVHFDCVIARINSMEVLEKHDQVCYIGGGRFGVVRYTNPPSTKKIAIKKIYEWEARESLGEWRKPISEYFSIT